MKERKDVLVGKKNKHNGILYHSWHCSKMQQINGNNKGIVEVLQQGIENKEER